MSEPQKLQLKFKSTVLEFLGWLIRWVGMKAHNSYWGFIGGATYEGYVMIGEPKLQLTGAIIPAGIRKAGEWQD
jgi:hypothetical protein